MFETMIVSILIKTSGRDSLLFSVTKVRVQSMKQIPFDIDSNAINSAIRVMTLHHLAPKY